MLPMCKPHFRYTRRRTCQCIPKWALKTEIIFNNAEFFCLLYFLGECPDGWLNARELGGCYLFAPNGPGLNWQQSVDYCASIGGFLTDILNQETETFLESSGFVQSNPNVRWWIGGNDIAQVSKYHKVLIINTRH